MAGSVGHNQQNHSCNLSFNHCFEYAMCYHYNKKDMPNIQFKIRITSGALTVMGPGKADLLDAIDACGSISAAAKQMKMSYRRAWELVDVMNKCFTEPLVLSSPGGVHGGGAQLTAFGRDILKSYRDLVAKSEQASQSKLAFIASNLK